MYTCIYDILTYILIDTIDIEKNNTNFIMNVRSHCDDDNDDDDG